MKQIWWISFIFWLSVLDIIIWWYLDAAYQKQQSTNNLAITHLIIVILICISALGWSKYTFVTVFCVLDVLFSFILFFIQRYFTKNNKDEPYYLILSQIILKTIHIITLCYYYFFDKRSKDVHHKFIDEAELAFPEFMEKHRYKGESSTPLKKILKPKLPSKLSSDKFKIASSKYKPKKIDQKIKSKKNYIDKKVIAKKMSNTDQILTYLKKIRRKRLTVQDALTKSDLHRNQLDIVQIEFPAILSVYDKTNKFTRIGDGLLQLIIRNRKPIVFMENIFLIKIGTGQGVVTAGKNMLYFDGINQINFAKTNNLQELKSYKLQSYCIQSDPENLKKMKQFQTMYNMHYKKLDQYYINKIITELKLNKQIKAITTASFAVEKFPEHTILNQIFKQLQHNIGVKS